MVVASGWQNCGILLSSFCSFSLISLELTFLGSISVQARWWALRCFLSQAQLVYCQCIPLKQFQENAIKQASGLFLWGLWGVEVSSTVIMELLLSCSQMWSELSGLRSDKHSIPAKERIPPTLFCTSLCARLKPMTICLQKTDQESD